MQTLRLMPVDHRFWSRKGRPIDSVRVWAKLFEDPEYKIVKQTTLKNGKFVSTIWLGLNHGWGEGPPLVFETMVFPCKGVFGDLDCVRYSTEKEALAGHERMLRKWQGGKRLRSKTQKKKIKRARDERRKLGKRTRQST
jgi:hypothetical protein